MVKLVKSCLQLSLKLANLTIGFVGVAMLIYGLWMIRVWQRDAESSPSSPDYANFPWFIHAFLGVGIALCAITCLGHIAANSVNSYCLSVVSFFFILSYIQLRNTEEIGMAADVFLNSHWEKDLPDDPSARFDDFVKSNIDVCQWVALLVVLAQGCSILFATILRTLGEVEEYSHDIEGELCRTKSSTFESSRPDTKFTVSICYGSTTLCLQECPSSARKTVSSLVKSGKDVVTFLAFEFLQKLK